MSYGPGELGAAEGNKFYRGVYTSPCGERGRERERERILATREEGQQQQQQHLLQQQHHPRARIMHRSRALISSVSHTNHHQNHPMPKGGSLFYYKSYTRASQPHSFSPLLHTGPQSANGRAVCRGERGAIPGIPSTLNRL